MGLRPVDSGDISLDDSSILKFSTRQRLANGLAHIPQDRQRQGLVMDFTVQDNLLLGREYEKDYSYLKALIHHKKLNENAAFLIETFGIEPAQSDRQIRDLSGGNQQKVVVAREMNRPNTKVYIIAHPTRGVDIGAIESIHRQLLKLRENGAAIILFSSELSELLALCDRIAVIYEGKIVNTYPASETSEVELGLLMTGGS